MPRWRLSRTQARPSRFDSPERREREIGSSRGFYIFLKSFEVLLAPGLLVVLNQHVFESGWCCSSDDGEGLWYTEHFDAACLDHDRAAA